MPNNNLKEVIVRYVTGMIRAFYFEHHAYPNVDEIEKELREQRQLAVEPEMIERIVNSVKAVEHGLRTGNFALVHRGTLEYSTTGANLIDAVGNAIATRKPPVKLPVLKEKRNPEEIRRKLIEQLMQLRENARDPGKKFPSKYKRKIASAVKSHPDSEVRQLAHDILSAMKKREARAIQLFKTGKTKRKPPLRRPPGSH